ncbi:uncharacterized protein LOC129595351 [Paramacrobiotus metropolitanus]|uniref:uncharacterized protein LOC129595351 n=1 Tax=Paramacrobiotus metropolitanus TaxID=2943436 RepID=UPI0024459707|nr:uncharacterized protein LOC129595351 [Paramacrobiotus metropolitanus]
MRYLGVITLCLVLSTAFAERLYGAATRGRGTAHLGDPNDQYIRVEAELIKLTNDGGVTANNAYCDTFGACDPRVFAHLDTDRPNAEWPGAVAVEYWPQVFEADNVNSPLINKKIKRDSCAKPYKDAVLRVYAEDYDPASHNDQINQWQCPITRKAAESEIEAQWSPVAECVPKFHPGKMNSVTLTYRYRVFRINKSQCDASLIASTPRTVGATTPRSG